MADRYWVGGTANWDGTAGTKWATTSGGAGGASVPTSADDVFFDANSTGTCTISSGNTGAKSITCTGFTGTLAGSAAITVSGSITLDAGMGFTYTGTLTLNGTGTLTTAGKTIGPLTINGSGITATLGDALTSSGTLTVTQGTFDTGSYNVTATSLTSTAASTRAITLNGSTLTLSASSGPSALALNAANLTFTAGTSQINLTNASATISAEVTFYNVAFTSTAAGTRVINGVNTFNNLTVTGPASAGVVQVTFNSRQTINGTLSTTGTAGNRRVWFRGVTYGIAHTLTINSAPSLTDADFRDIYVIGTAAPISGTRIGDLRGCRGITFDTPKSVYLVPGASFFGSDNIWASVSNGVGSNDNFPLAQDVAIIDDNSQASITILTGQVNYTGTIDISARTTAFTFSFGGGLTLFGDFTCSSSTTISGVQLLVFSGRNTQVITSAGKTFTQPIAIDTYGGTVELADALNIGSQRLTVTNGTFDTKNYNVTAGSFFAATTNVSGITLGSSTVTLSGASPITFSLNNTFTFNAGTSQINLTSTSNTSFAGGQKVFYNVSYTGTSAVTHTITVSNTYNNLTFTAPASAGLTQVSSQSNQTITGTLTVAGATAVRRIFVRSSTIGTTRTLTVGTLAADDCDFRDITIAGTAAGSSPTRAGDCGGNSGITFPSPKTVYWNLGGAVQVRWDATAWATTSGGTPDINNFPLAQDTAIFDDAGAMPTSGQVVAVSAAYNLGTFDASARTTAGTIQFSSGPVVYGDFTFGTGITSNSVSGPIAFSGRGTQNITSNSVTFGCSITVDCVTGTVQLADALALGSTRTLTLASGTFDAVSYNVTTGNFGTNNSFVRTLKLGSGTWTLSGTGTVWDSASITNLDFYKGTADIVLSDTSTTTRGFNGGGLSYNKLTIGGTTGTSTLTIVGNNQFTELASTKTVAHTIALGSTTQTFGKWTVTGTSGNVVTLTGTGTAHILAGACTDSIDYLAMGSIGFSANSPGEFYAGANSTGTAAAPVYRTAKPADSTRYWVGGTGNWSDTARWSTSSGGASGASVPRSHDDVVFDSSSNATAYTATVNAVTGGIRMKSLTIDGPASGNVTLAGSTAISGIHGNVTLPATGLTRTYTGAITLSGSTSGLTLTTNGVTLASTITVNGVGCEWTLGSALNIGSPTLIVTNGLFDCDTYNLTVGSISSNTGNSRTIDFGSGTITISGTTATSFGVTETNAANLTITAATSQINCTNSGPVLVGNGKTFYNVAFTSTSAGTVTLNGANTFNDLSFTGITISGLKNINIDTDQTINGTLTLSAGTNATMRHFVRSNTIGTTRTLTCAAVASLQDVDFRDITIAGAAVSGGSLTGTRLGDCKGNSGITFTAAADKYWSTSGGFNWSTGNWSLTNGGSTSFDNFPLAQDTVIFPSSPSPYPASGSTITINAAYNIGTIDMSARTTNTMTLSNSSNNISIYGNWINGTGTGITGSGSLNFVGRTAQTITSAGKTFTQNNFIQSPTGSVTLQDAYTSSSNGSTAIVLTSGTFDANGYNVTFTNGGGVTVTGILTKSIAVGSGTWLVSGITAWNLSGPTNTTVTGTGTISLTSASSKTFAGGGIDYSGITLDQGGAGTLTIIGNNTFANITNTYSATGATTINFGTTTQRVGSFTATGAAGNVLTLTGSSATSPCTLVHTGSGTAADVDYLTITGVRAY